MSLFRERFAANRSRAAASIDAIGRSQAIIEFTPDGVILQANAVFQRVVGYTAQEIVGKHHAMFMPEAQRESEAYRDFWKRLARGESISDRFARVAKGGQCIWLQASYNPVVDAKGRTIRVVKIGSDITAAVAREADSNARLQAIDRSVAVISFNLDGTILEANANFLRTMGYEAEEVVGQKHAMFVTVGERESASYGRFWDELRAGKAQAGRFMRIGKGGRQVWIEASYNPVMGPDGRQMKVLKYATDITNQQLRTADVEGRLAAIDKVQAIIEFDLDGTIITANENFLRCVGYTLDEVRGRHHRMFVSPGERESAGYAGFWSRIASGEPLAGEFQRLGKNDKEVWLQASYSPIIGADGKPYKAIKYATDVTAQVNLNRSLRELVAKVQVSAGSISSSAGEISSGNADLSARTEAAAASLEETAASMEELTATVKQSSESARQASRLADDAANAGGLGTTAVESVNATMQEIRAASRRIEEIIGVIDGIAFQTNILALNAAVEAARAGEQGRGFAVVASEVRALAQRCSVAAKDIKGLISNSAASVQAGTERVAEAGRAVAEVSTSVSRLTGLLREIAAAAVEQAAGIEQINTAVVSLDQGTQQNAALVEEASAATQSLDDQAAQMLELVTNFMASNDLGSTSSTAAAPSRGSQRLRAVRSTR